MEYFRRRTPSDRPFEGQVVGGGFQFSRNISYRNSFLPQIRARIELDPQGTVVQLRMSLHPLVVAFMAFWIVVVSLALFGSLASEKQGALIPGAMILFALALTAGGSIPRRSKLSASSGRRLRQPPNTRLKLPAPVVCGRIAFVNVRVRRRSLGAFR